MKGFVLQCKILNKLKYKLEHKSESFYNETEDKDTLTIIVQMAVKKKKFFISANNLNNFYFCYIGTL